MKQFFRFFDKRVTWLTISTIVVILIASVLEVMQPLFLNKVIEILQEETDPFNWASFWAHIGYLTAITILGLLFSVLGSYIGTKVSVLLARNIRVMTFEKSLNISYSNLDKISTASIITRLTNDVQKIQVSFQLILTMFIKAPFTLISGFVFAFIINAVLGSVIAGIMVVLIISVLFFVKVTVKNFEKSQRCLDSTNLVMRETILGSRTIKAFNLEQNEIKKFKKNNRQLLFFTRKTLMLLSILTPLISLFFQVGMGVILIIAGVQLSSNIGNSGFTASDVFAFTQIFFIILAAMIIAIFVIVNFTRTLPSIRRVNNVFKVQSEINYKDNAMNIDKIQEISFDNVDFKYEKSKSELILNNISFSIKANESLGIIGGTGSGKSTIINLLLRNYDPMKGRVLINGVDLKEYSKATILSHFKSVAQDNFLFAGTIKDNIAFNDKKANLDLVKQSAKIACAEEFIKKMPKQYLSKVESRGKNFSGGQKQRISIARTIYARPEVLILDDASSALDMITEKKLHTNIHKYQISSILIVIAQRISSVKNCDKIIVLDKGKISGIGTHEKLAKTNKIYRQIIASQEGK